jgi:RNA polymerase sigma factor (sigma-70 family)
VTAKKKSSEAQQAAFFRSWALARWELVNRLARRRFSDELLAEEAALFVLEKLSADRWQSLRRYRGAAKLQTYFVTLVSRRLEDFARKRFGRVRPPQWLIKLGGIWLLLYRLLCYQRLSFNDALEIAIQRYQEESSARIEQIAEHILAQITSCGQEQQQTEFTEEHEISGSTSLGPVYERQQQTQVLAALGCQLLGEPVDPAQAELLEKLVKQPVALSPEERLLLKLCHRDGLSVSEAGRMLGLNRFQTHGRLKRLYSRIREAFELHGLAEELRLLLKGEPDT